jgi:hypothetical protein
MMEEPPDIPPETPAEPPAVTPAEPPAVTPAETAAETPRETPAEARAMAPPETPAEPHAPPPAPQLAMSAPSRPRSGGLRFVIVAIILVALIVIAIIGYAVVGYAAGESRVSEATKSLNTVTSDQNKFTTTFNSMTSEFSGLSTGSNFDAQQAKTLVDQFVADSQASSATVDKDEAILAAAATKLDDQSWLTAVDKGNIDKAHARFNHALKALAAAKVVSDDYAQDGQFLQAFMDTAIDLDKLGTQASSNDLTGALATVAAMKAHVATLVQRSTAPGFGPEWHSLAVDFQTMTSDFGSLLTAAQAADDAGVTTYSDKVSADVTKLSAYDFTKMGAAIDAFYKPYIDTFNTEMAAATA